jgi:hypothetical protein
MKKVLVVEIKEAQQNTRHVMVAICYNIDNSTDRHRQYNVHWHEDCQQGARKTCKEALVV